MAGAVKPAPFEYCRPDTVDEVLELLTEFGSDASVIAGGLSLGAMLNMRLVRPAAVIDINSVGALAESDTVGDAVVTGALVRQTAAMPGGDLAAELPLLAAAMPHVGHYQTRCYGTLGGSVAHADPSAEIPLCLVTLGGAVRLHSARGVREVPAGDFFRGILTTDRHGDELITGLVWPRIKPGVVTAFDEISQRRGDFAIAAVAAAAHVDEDGRVDVLSLGLGGVEERPFLADTSAFAGLPANGSTAREIARAVAAETEPLADLQANSDYRRNLAAVLAERVLARVFAKGAV